MSKEAMKQALEALEGLVDLAHEAGFPCDKAEDAITSLRQAIAEAEKQEPVAWMHKETALLRKEINKPKGADWDADHWIPLYTTPQQRKPLTDDEIAELWLPIYASTPPSGIHEDGLMPWRLARAIEAAHGIKEKNSEN